MNLKLFKTHCPVCGHDVEKKNAIKRFGKYMCSEEHAQEYGEKLDKKPEEKKSGGCC